MRQQEVGDSNCGAKLKLKGDVQMFEGSAIRACIQTVKNEEVIDLCEAFQMNVQQHGCSLLCR